MKKVALSALLANLFIFTLLSIFISPAYTSLYVYAFGETEMNAAQWTAIHLPSYKINLDGSGQLNQLIALYSYPNHIYAVNLSVSRMMEKNALIGTYSYPVGMIITTRKPLTIGATVVKGLSDAVTNSYINKLPVYTNKIFSNYICEIFVS
jgi:hypothetical protein